MSALRDLQQRFARQVLADAPADDGDAGLRVYRNAVRANYRNALAATFPVVRELTGAPFFNAAVDAFVAVLPPASGDLNVYGDAFPGFLAEYPHAATLPYLPDVARLEWALDEAARAADPPATPAQVHDALAAMPPAALATLRFALDGSCRLLHAAYPVLRIWQAHQVERFADVAIDFAAGTDRLLVRRDDVGAGIERLPPGEFAWLSALAQGDDLATALAAATAADDTFDLAVALRARIADGTLSTPMPAPPVR